MLRMDLSSNPEIDSRQLRFKVSYQIFEWEIQTSSQMDYFNRKYITASLKT